MTLLKQLRGYGRFAAGLHRFLKSPLTLEDARRITCELEEQRAENFLRVVQRGVFEHPTSPFLKMMQHAGITLADVRAMVSEQGLEASLQALYAAGVYVTFEEYKGRKPLVRGNLTLNVSPVDFENPHLVEYYTTTTSGTTGAGTRIGQDLDFQRMVAVLQNLAYDAHGVYHVPTALWRGILPDGSGINNTLKLAAFGHVPEKWFSHTKAEPFKKGYLKFAIASYLLVVAANAYGIPIAWPQYVRLDQGETVARWAEQTLKKHPRCFIMTTASRGLRVALAAEQAGINLTGTVFAVAGEPVTDAKVDAMRRVGAAVFTTYGTAEVGRIGMGCADPSHHTDVHVNTGLFSVWSQPLHVEGFAEPVDALCVTTLSPTSPFLFINYLSDDYGVLERRTCGCSIGALGLDLNLSQVYSYSKLTTEGATLAGSEMLRVLEQVLPNLFGGSMLDYQLQEEEDAAGFVRFKLVISPRVALADEQAVIDELMQQLRGSSIAAAVAQNVWEQAHTVRIAREEPVVSERGKYQSIRKLKRGSA